MRFLVSPGEPFLAHLWPQTDFSMKRWDPHTIIAFWHFFSRFPASRGQQKERRKTASKNDHFLKCANIAFLLKLLKNASPLDPPKRIGTKKKHEKHFAKTEPNKNLIKIEKAVLLARELNSGWRMSSHVGKTSFLIKVKKVVGGRVACLRGLVNTTF